MSELREAIIAIMADGQPRTSNDIALRLYGTCYTPREWWRVSGQCDRLASNPDAKLTTCGKRDRRTIYQASNQRVNPTA